MVILVVNVVHVVSEVEVAHIFLGLGVVQIRRLSCLPYHSKL